MSIILDISYVSDLVMVDIDLWNKKITDYSRI